MESKEFEGIDAPEDEEEDKEIGSHAVGKLGGSKDMGEAPEKGAKERRWVWAFPLIEGVPPCPRGGHTATLAGQSLIIFGGHYYCGKEIGYVYLNDVHILDVNQNRWMVTLFLQNPKLSLNRPLKSTVQPQRPVISTPQY